VLQHCLQLAATYPKLNHLAIFMGRGVFCFEYQNIKKRAIAR